MNSVCRTPAPRRRRAALARAVAVAFAGVPMLAAAQQPCNPLGIPASLLTPSTEWAVVAKYLPDSAFTPTFQQGYISPCNKVGGAPCDSMLATIRAQKQAHCVTTAQINDPTTAYVLGKVHRLQGHGYGNLGLGKSNVESVIYFLVSNGVGVTIFHKSNDSLGMRRNQGQGVGWRFQVYPDTPSDSSYARWLLDSQNQHRTAMLRLQPTTVRGGPADLLADDAEMAQMGDPAFGWMTCAPGCCQFHGTPSGGDGDNDDDDVDDDDQGHHGHQGHQGHQGQQGRREMTVTKDQARPERD